MSDIRLFEEKYGPGETKYKPKPEKKSPTEKFQNPFCRTGDIWEVRFKDKETYINNIKDVQYISFLLRHPSQEFFPSQFAMYDRENDDNKTLRHYDIDLSSKDRKKYEETTERFYDKVAISENSGNTGQIEHTINELEFHKANLPDQGIIVYETEDGDFNKLVYKKRLIEAEEKERQRIYKNIKRAIRKIGLDIPELAEYLTKQIKTGNKFCYEKDPYSTIDWDIKF